MKKIVIQVPKYSTLESMNKMMLHYEELAKQIKDKADMLKETCRRSLQIGRPDIDWSTVHDLRFNPGSVELITFEHPLEQLIGPMTEEDMARIEDLRAGVRGAGLSQDVKKQ